MNIEVFELIAAMIIFTPIIMAVFSFNADQMEGLNSAASDFQEGEGKKVAASFHVVNSDGRSGMLDTSYSSFDSTSSGGCTNAFVPGLNGDPFAYTLESGDCGSLSESVIKLKTPLYVSPEEDYDNLTIGGPG